MTFRGARRLRDADRASDLVTVLSAQGRLDALEQPLPHVQAWPPPSRRKTRTIGKWGCIAALSAAGAIPASRAYSACRAELTVARSGSSACSGSSSEISDMGTVQSRRRRAHEPHTEL